MVTLFDDKTSLGLIRLRINQVHEELSQILSSIFGKERAEVEALIRSREGWKARMPFINFSKDEIQCKIVYYGAGFCGKTTNLQYIFGNTRDEIRGKMVSIDTKGDRTLFFDFLSLNLGKIRGFDIRVQLYTVPGQVHYDATRKLVFKGVDGVVFVADSLKVQRKKEYREPDQSGKKPGRERDQYSNDPACHSI